MRPIITIFIVLVPAFLNAQQVDWLTSSPVGFELNPGMPEHTLTSAPGRLVGMRTVDVELTYNVSVYGSVALDALDPATGSTLLSCLLQDSVSVQAAVVDPAGIAYFTGRFMGDALEFCDGSQVAGIGGGLFTENLFLLAWDLSTGGLLWMRNLSATYSEGYEVPSIALDPSGNLWYVMQDFMDGRVVRVDDEGDDVEVRPISGIRRFGTISFDPWGGLYVAGSCENGTLTFGGQGFPVESDEGYNMFVLRYKPDGTAGFAEFSVDATFQDPVVVATSDGHAYLSGVLMVPGSSWGGLEFEGTSWGSDIFLVKLDSTGQFLWGLESTPASNGITGDLERSNGPNIAVDANDHVYLIGTLRGLLDWGNGVVSDGITLGARSITVVAFAPDGTPQWSATSMPSSWFAQAQTITVMAGPDAVHFAAHVATQFTFGAHTTNIGGQQASVVGRIGGLSTGTADGMTTSGLVLWPNPASSHFFVELPGNAVLPAELLSSAGQRVRRFNLSPGRNAIDLADLAPGLYLLSGAEGVMGKVMVE